MSNIHPVPTWRHILAILSGKSTPCSAWPYTIGFYALCGSFPLPHLPMERNYYMFAWIILNTRSTSIYKVHQDGVCLIGPFTHLINCIVTDGLQFAVISYVRNKKLGDILLEYNQWL